MLLSCLLSEQRILQQFVKVVIRKILLGCERKTIYILGPSEGVYPLAASSHWLVLWSSGAFGSVRACVCVFVRMYVAPCVRMYVALCVRMCVWVGVYGVYVRMCVCVIRGRVGL